MKNSGDLGGCYSASVDNTLLDLQNSSYPTKADVEGMGKIFDIEGGLNREGEFN